MPLSVRELYGNAAIDQSSHRLSEFARVGIGYVSGDNNFFHLRPSDAKRWRIPSALLQPTIRNGRSIPKGTITAATVKAWTLKDEKILLLRLTRGQELPTAVRQYLDSSGGKIAQLGYKCRNRTPWYAVPDVQIPDFVMSYMSGRTASLVRNAAGATCTNSVHSVRIKDKALAAKLLPTWSSPFLRLSCELEGHALGGGMLKLEPREAGRILFPSPAVLKTTKSDELEDAIVGLQRWRHYAN
jgi:hypothetical protein